MPIEELPPLTKFLPPPPDVLIGGLVKVVGEVVRIPIKAVKAVGGVVDAIGDSAESAIGEIETLPGRE